MNVTLAHTFSYLVTLEAYGVGKVPLVPLLYVFGNRGTEEMNDILFNLCG